MSPTIREVMTVAPHTIGSDQTLAQAHKVMREFGLRHLPVLRGGELVGIVSQRDLYFLETLSGVDVDVDRVADAMSKEVYTTAPDEPLQNVASTMATHKYGCAVVLDETEHNVIGIFTATDALRSLAEVLVDSESRDARESRA